MEFEAFDLIDVSPANQKPVISRPLLDLSGPPNNDFYYLPAPSNTHHKHKKSTLFKPLPLINLMEVQNSNNAEQYMMTPRMSPTPSHAYYDPITENHYFKPSIFFEFLFYFLLKAFFGPLSTYYFNRFVENGRVLMNNLEINEGRLKNIVWALKCFCFISTFIFKNPSIIEWITSRPVDYQYDSTSQFWLLIHTEISLCVLYGAYYASLTDSELFRLRSQDCRDGTKIFDRIMNMIRLGKAKLYEMLHVAKSFPEIDVDNFYFVYPKESAGSIPEELQQEGIDKNTKKLHRIDIVDGVIVQCDKYARHIAEFAGYQKLDVRVKMIQFCSKALVFFNAILPVLNNIYAVFRDTNKAEHSFAIGLYVMQQVFYSYLLFRLAAVYDVLFLGLLLYYKKYQMLSLLGEVIKLRPDGYYLGLLYIPTSVPQNIQNWLAVRKVLATINSQAFVVIDLNMSFVLLYTLLFITFYAMMSFGVATAIFLPFQQFLKENKGLQTTLTLTIIVVSAVLTIAILLGILINRLFMYEKHEWILQETVVTNIKVNSEIYEELAMTKNLKRLKNDTYYKMVDEMSSLLGHNLKGGLGKYSKRLRDSIILVIKALDHMEFFNPHTLLGIRTDVRLVVMLGTAISAIGFSTIMRIMNYALGEASPGAEGTEEPGTGGEL